MRFSTQEVTLIDELLRGEDYIYYAYTKSFDKLGITLEEDNTFYDVECFAEEIGIPAEKIKQIAKLNHLEYEHLILNIEGE